MKYYKLLTKQGYSGDCFIVDKIYPETFTEGNIKDYYSVKEMSENHPSSWEEVLAGEYFVQEGVMPEYFAIKRVANNPLWGKYIDWLNNTYFNDFLGCIDEYYGFDNRVFIHAKLKYFKNNPVELTLEQWDKIINKTMEENDKKIIGWKLKEDCEQYKQAALNIVNNSKFYNFAEGYNFSINSSNESDLKKAGVLELWFTPVYKEENFEVGVWYTLKEIPAVCCKFTGNSEGEGTDHNNNWRKAIYMSDISKWRKATLEEVKAVQYPQITINDYKGEFFDWGVKFGCAKIDKNWFLQFYEIMRTVTYSNKEIESVTIGKGTFTKDQIKEIAEYYNKK